MKIEAVKANLEKTFSECKVVGNDQATIITDSDSLLSVAQRLKSHEDFQLDVLLDLCAVDYLHYGLSEWDISNATETGFGRAQASQMQSTTDWDGPRFVVVCHLLSTTLGIRVRLKVYLDDTISMPSLTGIWPSANWYEREAYDLFGINFTNHPDLRRILTDYGFIGFPFRKDFPLVGTVEMRYDGKLEKCIYEPVSIENRVGVPKVIRNDARYISSEESS